jgi:hypothetical protein
VIFRRDLAPVIDAAIQASTAARPERQLIRGTSRRNAESRPRLTAARRAFRTIVGLSSADPGGPRSAAAAVQRACPSTDVLAVSGLLARTGTRTSWLPNRRVSRISTAREYSYRSPACAGGMSTRVMRRFTSRPSAALMGSLSHILSGRCCQPTTCTPSNLASIRQVHRLSTSV